MENETKVVKFEIGKLLAVVITVIVVAAVATVFLNGRYFKGSTIDTYVERVDTTNQAATVDTVTPVDNVNTSTATINEVTPVENTSTATATINEIVPVENTNTETATVNEITPIDRTDENITTTDQTMTPTPNTSSVRCAGDLTYNAATNQCCTQPDASGAVTCS